MNDQQNITLTVSKDEALVLFEFLARFNQYEHPDIFEDQVEQKVLWIIEVQLEKQLVEPFNPDYKDHIRKIKDKLRDKE
jgi:hypothetical protein